MVYSVGMKSVYETDPVNEVMGGAAAWERLAFENPDEVDVVAKGGAGGQISRTMGMGYRVVEGSAPKKLLWKSKTKLPPDYAFGNNEVMLVSSRFRDLVEQFEPGVHQFLPVSVYNAKDATEPFDTFYWFVCCTLIDSLDPEHTTLDWKGFYDDFTDCGLRRGLWSIDLSVKPPQKAVFSLKAIGDRHLWRDPYRGRDYVHCSDAFGEALIAAELTGFGLRQYEQM
ncbi:MAG: DUF1629 domain-containing protein [Pseudomonadota bacterium]